MEYTYTDIVYDKGVNEAKEVVFNYNSKQDLEDRLSKIAWHICYSLLPQAFLTELLYHVVGDWKYNIWMQLLETCCKYSALDESTFALKWLQVDRRLQGLKSQNGIYLTERYKQVYEKLKQWIGDYENPIYGYFYVLSENCDEYKWKVFLNHLRNANEQKGERLRLPKIMDPGIFLVWFNQKLDEIIELDKVEFQNCLEEMIDRGMIDHLSAILETDASIAYKWMSAGRKYLLSQSERPHGIILSIWTCFLQLNISEKGRFLMAKDVPFKYDRMVNAMPYWLYLGENNTNNLEKNNDLELCIGCLKQLLLPVWGEDYCSNCAMTLAVHSYVDTIVNTEGQESIFNKIFNADERKMEGNLAQMILASNHLSHAILKCPELFRGDIYSLERSCIYVTVMIKKRCMFLSNDYLDELLRKQMVLASINNTFPIGTIVECIRSFIDYVEIDSTVLCYLGRLLRWLLSVSRDTDLWNAIREIAKGMSLLLKLVEQPQHKIREIILQSHLSFVFLLENLLDVCYCEAELANQQEGRNNLPLTNCLLRIIGVWCQRISIPSTEMDEKCISFLISKLWDIRRPKIQANSSVALQIFLQHSQPNVHRRDLIKNCSVIECLIDAGLQYYGPKEQILIEHAKIEHSLLCILLLTRDETVRTMLCRPSLLTALSQMIKYQTIRDPQYESDVRNLGDIFKIGLWYFANALRLDRELCKNFLEQLICQLINITESQWLQYRIVDDIVFLLELSFQYPELWSAFRENLVLSQFEEKLDQIVTFMRHHQTYLNDTNLSKLPDLLSRLRKSCAI